MTKEEASDLFYSSQAIGKIIEREYKATSLTFVIQDGKDSGQTVPHVHIHIIPRRPNDFQPNDLIYDIIEGRAKPVHNEELPWTSTSTQLISSQKGRARVDNESRCARSKESMASEADWLSTFFID